MSKVEEFFQDPKDKDNVCSGEIEVTKRGKSYNYQAFLFYLNNVACTYKDIEYTFPILND